MDDSRFKHPDWHAEHVPDWKEWLRHLRHMPDVLALEIGSFEGRSACWLLENILTHETARLVCIDPFDLGKDLSGQYDTKELLATFERNVLQAYPKKVVHIKDYSARALRKIEDSFDFIYVDGSHLAADTLTDGVLAWTLLKPGGILIFDDYDWPWQDKIYPNNGPRKAVDAFVSVMGPQISHLKMGLQAHMRKVVQ